MSHATRISALEVSVSAIDAKLDRLLAHLEPKAPAKVTRPAPAPQAPAVTTKPLSRQAWQQLRRTRGGQVKARFAGLTREQAFEAGLCEGFHLPTGERKAAIQAWKAAQAS